MSIGHLESASVIGTAYPMISHLRYSPEQPRPWHRWGKWGIGQIYYIYSDVFKYGGAGNLFAPWGFRHVHLMVEKITSLFVPLKKGTERGTWVRHDPNKWQVVRVRRRPHHWRCWNGGSKSCWKLKKSGGCGGGLPFVATQETLNAIVDSRLGEDVTWWVAPIFTACIKEMNTSWSGLLVTIKWIDYCIINSAFAVAIGCSLRICITAKRRVTFKRGYLYAIKWRTLGTNKLYLYLLYVIKIDNFDDIDFENLSWKIFWSNVRGIDDFMYSQNKVVTIMDECKMITFTLEP